MAHAGGGRPRGRAGCAPLVSYTVRVRHRLRRPEVALVLLLAVLVVPLVKEYTAQPAARYSFTAALWDDRSRLLDDYVIGVDRIEIDGHVYSDKAPGQPYLMVPFYAAYRLVGGDPAKEVQLTGDLGLWWNTLWSSMVPALALCWLMWRAAARVDPASAIFAAGAMAFGSMLLPFSSELFAHVLSATLAFGAWQLLTPSAPVRRPLLAGLLGGLAILAEYPSALLLAPMGLALLARRELGMAARFVIGAIPGVAALAAYQAMVTGSAEQITYAEKDSTFSGVPDLGNLVQIFVGYRGMLIFTPIVVAAVVGLVYLIRERSEAAVDAWVGLGAFLAVLWLQASWVNPWGGGGPGPRYLTPALPFLAIGAGAFARRHQRYGRAFLAVSVVTMGAATINNLIVPDGGATLVSHVKELLDGPTTESLFTLAVGPAGWLVHAALVVAAAWHLRSCLRQAEVAG